MTEVSRREQEDAEVTADETRAFILWLIVCQGYNSADQILADFKYERVDLEAEITLFVMQGYVREVDERIFATRRGVSVIRVFDKANSTITKVRELAHVYRPAIVWIAITFLFISASVFFSWIVLLRSGEEVSVVSLALKSVFIGGVLLAALLLFLMSLIVAIIVTIILGKKFGVGPQLGCFPGGTMVTTPEGHKRIDCISIGDSVTSFDERLGAFTEETVVGIRQSQVNRLVNVMAEGLAVGLRCTGCHPVYTSSGIIPAGSLSENHRLVRLREGLLSQSSVTAISWESVDEKVYNVYVSGLGNYFADSQLVACRYHLRTIRSFLLKLTSLKPASLLKRETCVEIK